jgi:multiple sugar transport system permease protein
VYLYTKAFFDYEFGYASAMAWVLFVIIAVLTWLATRAANRRVHYSS